VRSAERRRRPTGPPGPPEIRVGLGTDLHPLAPGRRLVLGGVEVPHDRGLAGHSDADALTHAVCDALLGALGEPDLGTRFPDGDRRHRGRRSLEFLQEIAADVRGRGWTVVNVDAVLLVERPRLRPHLEAMRGALASALGCEPGRVGVKAKRCEGLGALGRGEGIAAQAVALLRRSAGRGSR
jgi:2-C-methyl-D-erythritol 2,4-cyclodiphosphate synthase